jgi:2-succinyl-5-enolpyruvyl-6-hydroxy-3-cyclohexene-1-carboxylate synthase
MRRGLFDCVLRLGNVPTARLWRDLEAPSCAIPVVSLGSLPFTGLSRGVHCWGDVAALAPALATGIEPRPGEAEFLRGDAERALGLDRALRDLPHSEPGMIAALSRLMSAEASVYLGNSSPIREWDLAADRARPRWAQASRGANGIDGQISTFLGGVRQGRDAWAIIGDLTALYDLAAPWALPFLPSASVRVAVVNNGGGKIFSRIFGSELFENRHSLRFDHFAKAWGVSYERWASIPQSPVAAAVSRPDRPIDRADGRAAELIEILPNEAETAEFWLRYDSLWQEA